MRQQQQPKSSTTNSATVCTTLTTKKRYVRVGYLLITGQQLEEVMQKLFAETSFSVVSNSKEKKTAAGRKCPLCEKRMGNFGPNFKNHVKKCCPTVFEEIMHRKPEYFGTLAEMKRAGLVDSDDEVSHEDDACSTIDPDANNQALFDELDLDNPENEFLTKATLVPGSQSIEIDATMIDDINMLMRELTSQRQKLRRAQWRKIVQKQPPPPPSPSSVNAPSHGGNSAAASSSSSLASSSSLLLADNVVGGLMSGQSTPVKTTPSLFSTNLMSPSATSGHAMHLLNSPMTPLSATSNTSFMRGVVGAGSGMFPMTPTNALTPSAASIGSPFPYNTSALRFMNAPSPMPSTFPNMSYPASSQQAISTPLSNIPQSSVFQSLFNQQPQPQKPLQPQQQAPFTSQFLSPQQPLSQPFPYALPNGQQSLQSPMGVFSSPAMTSQSSILPSERLLQLQQPQQAQQLPIDALLAIQQQQEQSIKQLPNHLTNVGTYSPWKQWLIDDCTLRYLRNCRLMNDIFYDASKSDDDAEAEDEEKLANLKNIRQELEQSLSKLDEEIENMSTTNGSCTLSIRDDGESSFADLMRRMRSNETAKRKLKDYFASHEKITSTVDVSSKAKPNKRRKLHRLQ